MELKSFSLLRGQAPEKMVTLVLLFFLLTIAIASVTSVLTGPDWNALWKGLALGLLLGWSLALFRGPIWISIPVSIVSGATYALFYAGGLRQKFFSLLGEFYVFVGNLAASSAFPPGDPQTIRLLFTDFFNTSAVIFERVSTWLFTLGSNEPVFDPVAAAFVWALVVWLIAAWAGWSAMAYGNALIAILPVVLVSVATLAYGRSDSLSLYLMLGLTLLLLATIQHMQREQVWDQGRTAYPPRKGRQIGVYAVAASAGLVLLAMVVSSVSLPRILEWVSPNRGAAVPGGDNLAKSLGIVSRATSIPDPFEKSRRPGLPREALIGSGPELSQQMVMTVALEDYPSMIAGRLQHPPYWRSFTYDTYTGKGWRSSATTTSQYPANMPLQADRAPERIQAEQTVRLVARGSTVLYAAGDPVSVNTYSEVARRTPDDLFGILLESDKSYQVSSLISMANEKTLRAEGYEYPSWVHQYFLELPPGLPSRVTELALELTAAAPTPYDRVRAIEEYLRSIPYTLDVPYPPQDQDLVDYFLFDLRKGYCDYYASAMVVLARAAGVPARFVIGYANGIYDLKTERFLVSEADAHSWVEVYFPNAGWVPFEPTAGRPPLSRSAVPNTDLVRRPAVIEETPQLARLSSNIPWWLAPLGILSSICFLVIVWVAVDEIRMRDQMGPPIAGEIYHRLRRFGALLGMTLVPGDTPSEYTDLFISKVEPISHLGVSHQFHSRLVERVSTLTNQIVDLSFNPTSQRSEAGAGLFKLWKQLRWQMGIMWLIMHYQSGYKRIFGVLSDHSRSLDAGAGERISQDG